MLLCDENHKSEGGSLTFADLFRESANIGGFSEARRVQLFLPGIGALVNHHPVLDNGTFIK